MNPCERCGAMNQPQSRFCVACGAPLVAPPAPSPTGPAVRPATNPSSPQVSPTAPPYASPYPVSQAPNPNVGWPQTGPYAGPATAPPPANAYPHAVIQPYEGPPSASLPFAETATPGTGIRGRGPQGPFVPPPGAIATAAMPGVEQEPSQVPEGAPKILAGFLISYESDPLGAFWPIHQGPNVVGREGAAPGLSISINHPTTSSRHAVLYAAARPGRLQLEDLGSTNGTFVNDSRLSTGQRVELRDGDVVRFGLFSALVKIV